MADYVPVLIGTGVEPQSFTTSGAVVGGTFAAVSGAGTVATAGAASTVVIGVFAFDAASGQRVSVWPIDGVVHEMATVSTNVVQGNGIQSAAGGLVDPATTSIAAAAAAGTLLGVATTSATAPAKVRFSGRH